MNTEFEHIKNDLGKIVAGGIKPVGGSIAIQTMWFEFGFQTGRWNETLN